VRVTRNITKHGFALNVCPDLSYFAGIIPCGITDKGVTSMRVLGSRATVDEVAAVVTEEFWKS
jgi:lipoyl(octanoyl) transferase